MGALIIYTGAMVLFVILVKNVNWNLKYLAIIFDVAAIIVLGFLPETMNPVEALYPVFFVTAFQWCVFKGAKGYVSSTIFSTNNLKQTVLSAADYLLDKGNGSARRQKAEKVAFFGGTLFSFHFGVGFEYLMWLMYDIHSIWFGIIPLMMGMILLIVRDIKIKAYDQKQDSISCL